MTTNQILSRSLVSRPLAALSAILSLAIAVALTAAPSTARAETGAPPTMTNLKVPDQAGLSFPDVVSEVNGNQVVITAEVAVTGTAGKPRTGTVVFSAFVDYSDDVSFMDYTDDACMASQMSRQAGDQACAAISRALRDAAPSDPIVAPSTPAEGIIMRDGGICDPIRHMGC